MKGESSERPRAVASSMAATSGSRSAAPMPFLLSALTVTALSAARTPDASSFSSPRRFWNSLALATSSPLMPRLVALSSASASAFSSAERMAFLSALRASLRNLSRFRTDAAASILEPVMPSVPASSTRAAMRSLSFSSSSMASCRRLRKPLRAAILPLAASASLNTRGSTPAALHFSMSSSCAQGRGRGRE